MPFTNFPNGITSMGIPVLGGAAIPFGVARDAKVFFIDPRIGSDSNDGLSPRKPLAIVAPPLDFTAAMRRVEAEYYDAA